MSRYPFSDAQRWAVYETHAGITYARCWLCDEPLFFRDMQVDHILPEWLLDEEHETRLKEVLKGFGLDDSFKINSYSNWLPAHGHCNNKKREHIFRPTPIIQVHIDKAIKQAANCALSETSVKTDRKKENAINVIMSAGNIPREAIDALIQSYAAANTSTVMAASNFDSIKNRDVISYSLPMFTYIAPEALALAPGLTIIFDSQPKLRADGPFTYRIESSPREGHHR